MKRGLLAGAAYLILTLAFAAPLLSRLASAFPHDAGDPLLNTWLLWWSTQQLPFTHAWWQAPMFHPAADVMALSELLVGLLPLSAPVQWLTGSPLLAYNVVFLLTFPLCALSAAFLAHTLTGRRDAAFVAGLAFAFAPYRMGQVSHLQMLAYYGAPLVLAALHLYDRTAERRWLAVFGVAWLVQSLTNGYAMFHLSVLVGLWIVWFVRSRRALFEIAAAWALALLPMLPALLEYLDVHRRWHLERDINEIKRFGLDLADFASAPPEILLWGERLWTARPESAVFPGLTILAVFAIWFFVTKRQPSDLAVTRPTFDERVLAFISMAAALVAISALLLGPWRLGPLSVSDFHKPFSIAVYARLLSWIRSRAMREAWGERSVVGFYVVATIAMYLFALGPEPRILGRPLLYEPPYAWLMRLPGFDSLRVPGRFAMLAVLCQAVLLAKFIEWWGSRRVDGDAHIAVTARGAFALPAVLAVGVLIDGWARLPIADAPVPGPTLAEAATAVVEVPPGEPSVDFSAIYHQMTHQRPVLNGYSGYNPPHYLPLVGAAAEDLGALARIDQGGMLEAAIDRGRADAPELAARLAALPLAQRLPDEPRWLRFLIPQNRQAPMELGALVPIAAVSAGQAAPDAARVLDNDLDTAWSGGLNQIGNETFVVDLGSMQEIGAVVLELGSRSFGYPRELVIDAESADGSRTEIYRGPTSALTLAAALTQPERVPLSIAFAPVRARRLVLRQLGTAPGIPWWIAELRVHAPAR